MGSPASVLTHHMDDETNSNSVTLPNLSPEDIYEHLPGFGYQQQRPFLDLGLADIEPSFHGNLVPDGAKISRPEAEIESFEENSSDSEESSFSEDWESSEIEEFQENDMDGLCKTTQKLTV